MVDSPNLEPSTVLPNLNWVFHIDKTSIWDMSQDPIL